MAASLRKCANFLTTECHRILQNLRVIASAFQSPGPHLDLAVVSSPHPDIESAHGNKVDTSTNILDSIFSSFLLAAVPRNRRTVERRMTRRMQMAGHFEYAVPRNDVVACLECGHWHEKNTICAHCYSKVKEETEKLMKELGEDMKYTTDQKEVVFLYEGEGSEKQKHQGQHVVEVKKERPAWFPKSLLMKKDRM